MANSTIKKPTSKKFSKKSKSSRKLVKKAILDKEFSNLKSILPTMNNKQNVDQIAILNETVRMINLLEKQVFAKMANQKLTTVKPMNKVLLHELILNQNSSTEQVKMHHQ